MGTTPRPSISPLSNAYESTKNSPSLHRTGGMANGNTRTEYEMAILEEDDDEKDDSSILSELADDVQDEQPDARDIQRSMARKDDIDSEAETERLEDTPRRGRELVDGIGKTPSKLSRVEQPDDELSEPPSPVPNDIGAASSTSTAAGGKAACTAREANANFFTGKKRKRSDTFESSLSSEVSIDGDSPRKRAASEKKELSTGNSSRDEVVQHVPSELASKSQKVKGRRGRATRAEEAQDTVERGEEVIDTEVQEPAEGQVEEDPLQKSEAMGAFTELAKQFTAFRDALYDERIASVDAELALLAQPDCQHPEYLRMIACVEQRRVKQDRETRAYHHYRQTATQQRTLAERAQFHSQYFQTVREIREQALDSLGSSWYATQRERRQGVSSNAEDDNRHVYRYVDKRSDLLRQQAKYNREVSILSGIAKYVGFPAAPEISGIQGDTLDGDLKAMKVCRLVQSLDFTDKPQLARTFHQTHHSVRQPQQYHSHKTTPQLISSYLPRQQESVASAERAAHERFIEQHAWARAPQSINHQSLTSTPNISHTPEWAEHTSGFRKSNLLRDYPDAQAERPTPQGTPLNRLGQTNHEDSAEHNTRDFAPGSSPLQVPKQRINGNASNGWRDYSGTSTIDAPLGDNKESDAMESEQVNPIRRDLARDHETRPTMEGIHHRETPAMYGNDQADAYRSAGFRPLEGSFIPSASIAGRGIGSA